MFLKRFLLLALFVAGIAVLINYLGSQSKPCSTGVHEISVSQIGDEGYSLKGKLSFYNPSYFSTKLAMLHIDFLLNESKVGALEQPIDIRIKSNSSTDYPFEIRFAADAVPASDAILRVNGNAESGGFNGYTIPINDTTSVNLK